MVTLVVDSLQSVSCNLFTSVFTKEHHIKLECVCTFCVHRGKQCLWSSNRWKEIKFSLRRSIQWSFICCYQPLSGNHCKLSVAQ